jgi:hypothetical protein
MKLSEQMRANAADVDPDIVRQWAGEVAAMENQLDDAGRAQPDRLRHLPLADRIAQLDKTDRAVLAALHPDFVSSFSVLQTDTGLPRAQVVRGARRLRRLGFALLATAFEENFGHLRGRGYTPTGDGRRAQKQLSLR